MKSKNKMTEAFVERPVTPVGIITNPVGTDVNALITRAIDKSVSVETMEKLLSMRRELKAEQAKELFDNDMASFQNECPVIVKSRKGGKTESGIVAYMYAPIDEIVKQTKALISKWGFSYAIKTETGTDKVKAICIVKHRCGHSEQSDFEVPLGAKTRVMSDTQVVAAALTFAKRYAFCNAFGIITGDDDTDSVVEKSPPQKQQPTKFKVSDDGSVESFI